MEYARTVRFFLQDVQSVSSKERRAAIARRLLVQQHSGTLRLCWSFVLLGDFAEQLRMESISLSLFGRLFARRNLTSIQDGLL